MLKNFSSRNLMPMSYCVKMLRIPTWYKNLYSNNVLTNYSTPDVSSNNQLHSFIAQFLVPIQTEQNPERLLERNVLHVSR